MSASQILPAPQFITLMEVTKRYKMKLSVRLLSLGLYVVWKCYLMLPGPFFFRPALSIIRPYKQTQAGLTVFAEQMAEGGKLFW